MAQPRAHHVGRFSGGMQGQDDLHQLLRDVREPCARRDGKLDRDSDHLRYRDRRLIRLQRDDGDDHARRRNKGLGAVSADHDDPRRRRERALHHADHPELQRTRAPAQSAGGVRQPHHGLSPRAGGSGAAHGFGGKLHHPARQPDCPQGEHLDLQRREGISRHNRAGHEVRQYAVAGHLALTKYPQALHRQRVGGDGRAGAENERYHDWLQ